MPNVRGCHVVSNCLVMIPQCVRLSYGLRLLSDDTKMFGVVLITRMIGACSLLLPYCAFLMLWSRRLCRCHKVFGRSGSQHTGQIAGVTGEGLRYRHQKLAEQLSPFSRVLPSAVIGQCRMKGREEYQRKS
ncbi:hypothetical protein BaRGS_00000152 [Batillaria attramentaria]|uniref:Uncharacterized protein n=1 Tax=Batillaria attramentaria TaxID=370345 RepID=A0ABD0MBH5_9CAEN